MSLTALDIVVLVLVGGGAVLGAIRGFVTEILSLFAWVAAIAALKLFHGPATDLLDAAVGTRSGAAVLAFVLVFGITFFLGKLVAAQLGRRTRNSVLGGIDRALGLGFGALKGLLIATVLYLLATLAIDTMWGAKAQRPAWLRDSRSYPLLSASGSAVVDYVAERRRQRAAIGGGVARPGSGS